MLSALFFMTSCGGDDAGEREPSPGGAEPPVRLIVADAELATGPNDFVAALENTDGTWINDARLHLKFYFIDPRANDRKTYKVELDAEQIEPDEPFTLQRRDGSSIEVPPGAGIYKATMAFDAAGRWVVEFTGEAGGGRLGPGEVEFEVALEN